MSFHHRVPRSKALSPESFIRSSNFSKETSPLKVVRPIQDNAKEYESEIKATIEKDLESPLSDRSVVIPITKVRSESEILAEINKQTKSKAEIPVDLYRKVLSNADFHKQSKSKLDSSANPARAVSHNYQSQWDDLIKKETKVMNSIRSLDNRRRVNKVNSIDRQFDIDKSLRQIDQLVQVIRNKLRIPKRNRLS